MRQQLMFVYVVLAGAIITLLTLRKMETRKNDNKLEHKMSQLRFQSTDFAKYYRRSTLPPQREPWTTSYEGLLCQPWKKIVFIKTHKTASTTANTIIQRYGYLHNLTFALPRRSHIFQEVKLFSREQVFRSELWGDGGENRPDFDILAGHFRYYKPEVDQVVPRAMLVTILRDPVERFESAFGYYEVAKRLNLATEENPLETFMMQPHRYQHYKFPMQFQLRNGMMYTLGFPKRYISSDPMIDLKIYQLDNELDLVMLAEYFDESLILLKDLLCWEFEDILYIPKGFRNERLRNPMSAELRRRIRVWNKADVKLYEHFNRTFWEKVEAYGPSFQDDLSHFRRKQQEFLEECIDPQKMKTVQGKEDALVLRDNASQLCRVSYYRVFTFVTDLKLTALEKEYPDNPQLKSLRERGVEDIGLGKTFYGAEKPDKSKVYTS